MSNITNIPNKKYPVLSALRNFFEHRALWLYLIYDEAGKEGLDLEPIARKAIKRCGVYQGELLAKKGDRNSLKSLKKNLFGYVGRQIFEMKIVESTDTTLGVDFHYCPLVNAWKKQDCSDKQIDTLCDIAMCGDRGIAEIYGAVVDLPKTIAKGDGVCELRFHKIEANS
ncbi:MAG: L-2-amino-thiazoline-4-carboxylic acid hydrolase [Anaerolineaceae bacterium]|nr:L-2-amino-thiazoline-4-carboxylic acid hydrolase [Anaerolineaceae bacterium]